MMHIYQRRCIGRVLQGASAEGQQAVGAGQRPPFATQRRSHDALLERQRSTVRRQRRQFCQGRERVDSPRGQEGGLLILRAMFLMFFS